MGDISTESRKLLEKITLEGKLHKLYRKEVKDEKDIDSWASGFTRSFDVADRDVITNHKILWRRGDRDKADAPRFGVCANFENIKWLIDNERITRKMCDVELADWQNMNKLQSFAMVEVAATEDVDAIPATPVAEKRALDKVVTFLTGKLYHNITGPGAKTNKYFEDYKTNSVAMQRLWDKGTDFFLDDLKELFEGGNYITWQDAVKEIKKHCGIREEEEDIVDIFKKIKDIAMKTSKEMPMQTKILKMKDEFEKWMITDPAEFIHGLDMTNEHAASIQTVKEEYNCAMNLAFHCIIYTAGGISDAKWRKVASDFFNTIAEVPSYKAWQKKRNHFYQLLDKAGTGFSGQNSVEDRNDNEGVEEQNAINRSKNRNQPSRGGNRGNRGNFSNNRNNRNAAASNQNFRGNFRGNSRGLTSRNNYTPSRGGNNNSNTNRTDANWRTVNGKRQCYNCTNFAKRPVYHDFPFNGGVNCFYDLQGRLKKKLKVIAYCDGDNQGGSNNDSHGSDQNNGNNYNNSSNDYQGFDDMLNLPAYGSDTLMQNQIDHREGDYYTVQETPEGILVGAIMEGEFLDMDGKKAKGAEINFEQCKDENGMTAMATPILDCKFVKPNKPNFYLNGRLTFDSGAANSMINAKALEYCQWKKAGPRVKKYISAGGDDLPLWNEVVDVALNIAGQGMFVLKQVLVAETSMLEQVLVGRTDMNRLKIKMDFETQMMKIGVSSSEKWFPMSIQKLNSIATVKSESKDEPEVKFADEGDVMSVNQVYKEIEKWKSKEDKDNILTAHKVLGECDHSIDGCDCDRWSIIVQDGDNCRVTNKDTLESDDCQKCNKCVDVEWSRLSEIEKEKPDIEHRTGVNAEVYMNQYIERIRQRDLNSNSSEECTIDERIRREDPELYCAIKSLIAEYKDLFTGEIGSLGRKYSVKAEITGKLSSQRPGHQKFQGTTLVAVMKQFARQLAHGVIAKVEDVGVMPKNHMQILPVSKKDDDGNVLKAISATRVVVNAQSTNAHTVYSGRESDNLEDSIQFAAKASELGLNLKADISDAYYTIAMDKSMWPYFCITVPFIGTCCYLKLVQGWAPAAQMCQDVMGRIFFPLWENLRRYMDDVILASFKDRQDYLSKLRQFFSLCRQSGLKLKGKKCYFCVRKLNYLGNRIEDGKIIPSKHYVSRIDDIAMESIKTRSALKSYCMKIQYIARFMDRSAEVLKELREASNGDGKLVVEWNDKLKAAFDRSKRALKELSETYPFDPSLPTVMVIDTSLIATGGFLYQVGPEGPRLLSFFSRSRKDKERKCPLSSCHTETFGVVAGVAAFLPTLRQCKQTITIVVDSKPLVQAFQKFRNFQYSNDTRLNNALYQIRSWIDVNFVHTKNINPRLCLADVISRLDNFRTDKGCEGPCTICKAADMDNKDRLSTIATVNEWIEKGKNHGNFIEEGLGSNWNSKKDSYWFEIMKPEMPGKVLAMFASKQDHTIESFKRDAKRIRAAQEKHGDYSKILRDIKKGVTSYAKKKARLQTLLVTRSAKIENGILTLEKVINGTTYRVIPIPDAIAMEAISAVHKSIGHQSVHQLVKHAQRHFEMPKLKERMEKFVGKCIKCTLMKGGSGLKRKMLPVPLPKEMYTVILADEVVRTIRNKPLKYIIAMEGLSSFVTVVTYEGSMNGEKFVGILAHLKSILCPHNNERVKITLRCDKAKYHSSSLVKEILSMMNIELLLHESTTLSKNCVPELDVKIKNFSKNQIQILEDKPVTPEQSCHLAAAVCNNTIGHLGYTPAEIFSGRGWESNKTIQIDVQKILKELASRREQRRNEDERRRLKNKMKVERRLIPYKDEELNSPLVLNPNVVKIKVGDSVTLKQNFNKNEPKCAWKVIELDFENRKMLLKRDSGLDVRESRPKWFAFAMVDSIHPELNSQFNIERTQNFNDGFIRREESRVKFNEFLRKCMFIIPGLRATSDFEREFMDIPETESEVLTGESEAPNSFHIATENNDFSGEYSSEEWTSVKNESKWEPEDLDVTEWKEEDIKDEKKEEKKMKEEFEEYEDVSQETLEESKESLKKLEEFSKNEDDNQLRRSTRVSAKTGQGIGAFEKYFKF